MGNDREREKEQARQEEALIRYQEKFWHEIEDGNMPEMPVNWPVHYKDNGERDYFREAAEYIANKKEHDDE